MRETRASVGQRLLWLMEHYRGRQGTSLVQQVLWRMDAPVRTPDLEVALAALTDRHESLRTRLVARGRELVQQVLPAQEVEIALIDLDPADPARALRAALAADLRRPIDASVRPVRASLFRTPAGRPLLCLSLHHLVTDHWSNALVSRDLRAIHAGEAALPAVEWQYATWADWQHRTLTGASLERTSAYWRQALAGAALPDLSMLSGRSGTGGKTGGAVHRALAPATVDGLREVAKRGRTGLFPVMLAAFVALLFQRTGQTDLTVPSLFANRTRPEVAHTVGFFVNMVALRTSVDPDAAFTDLVRRVRGVTIQALTHQHLPFQMLPPRAIRSRSGRPDEVVFQVLDPQQSRADMQGEELGDLQQHTGNNRFALEFLLVPIRGELVALLRYGPTVFDEQTAARFLDDYVDLAGWFARNPDGTVRQSQPPLAHSHRNPDAIPSGKPAAC